MKLCVFEGLAGNIERFFVRGTREEVNVGLLRNCLQLINSGRTVHVGGNCQNFFLLFFFEPFTELAGGRRFTGTLKAG